MTRPLFLLFGVAAYLVFFLTLLYLIAFVGNLPWVPHTVDRGGTLAALALAAPIDLALIALFGVQHSVMARAGFKAAWRRIVPAPIERSVYVLLASVMLILLFGLWAPVAQPVWTVENRALAALLWALFALGWTIVLLSSFMISHFDLFGLKQVWGHLRGHAAGAPVFRTPVFYRLARHPLYGGFFLAFWATPAMSAGHLLLAGGLSAYMLIAIRYEERDLVRLFGRDYEGYRAGTGMLAPRLGRRVR